MWPADWNMNQLEYIPAARKSKSLKMDLFPFELWIKIFGHLNLSDLMSLRVVAFAKNWSKSWKRWRLENWFLCQTRISGTVTSIPCQEKEFGFFVNEVKELATIFSFSKYLLSSSFSNGPYSIFQASLREIAQGHQRDRIGGYQQI